MVNRDQLVVRVRGKNGGRESESEIIIKLDFGRNICKFPICEKCAW